MLAIVAPFLVDRDELIDWEQNLNGSVAAVGAGSWLPAVPRIISGVCGVVVET